MTENIRNFVIIAHVDAGKSTLADRFLEITGTVEKRQMKAQFLDQLELERERGITIKMAPVRMKYAPQKNADSTQKNAEDFLYKDITYEIRGAAFEVRKLLGLGHKESIYHNALAQEFNKRGLQFETEKSVGIFYDGKKIGSYKPDFIIENKIIIELKALPEIGRPQIEQLWSYIKGTEYKLALLINFGTKDLDIRRVVYDSARLPRPSASVLRDSAQVEYILNLIDTPGHPDFSYEVSRALAAVEGAILLVDATQGIQAQTLANFYAAKKQGLRIIGAVNKVDLNPPQLQSVIKETAELIGCSEEEIFKISAKTGEGVSDLLRAIIERVPSPVSAEQRGRDAEVRGNIPRESASSPRESAINARALIFDLFYDDHKGIIASVRVFNGEFKFGEEAKLVAAGEKFKIKELGYFSPQLKPTEKLVVGEIGYIATGIKEPEKIKIGDTIILNSKLKTQNSKLFALPGYQEPKPVVFVSFYPDGGEYDEFKKALLRLRLNDSALKIEPDFNEVLGRGFKIGFLGKLHFEITVERLEREFGIKTVNTFPSVAYKIKDKIIENVENLPDDFTEIQEPLINLEIISPSKYLGNIFQLKELFRIENIKTENLSTERILIKAKMPLSELISDFDDRLKSVSEGFASFSYELGEYQKDELEKMEILVAGFKAPGLTRIIPKNRIEHEARKTVDKLKGILPRQQFVQAIQAKAGGRIIARENVPALKKDVTGYLYGGDRTRKMKLWKKQQKGKKKLATLASQSRAQIPSDVFKKMLK